LNSLIQRALQDPLTEDESREEISRSARESFSMKRYGREMTGHYEELLTGGPRR